MEKLRVGFIGAGRIAELHALEYLPNERAEIVAVGDIDPSIAGPPSLTAWQGREILRFALAAQQSARAGHAVRL